MAFLRVLRQVACFVLIFKVVEGTNSNEGHSYHIDIEADPELEIYLREALENFREQMKEGNPGISMPILDPLYLQNVDLVVTENLAEMNLKIKQISIEDLSTFDLQNIYADLEIFFLKLKLTIPSVHSVGKYTLNGKLLKIFPLTGNGSFSINLTHAEISGFGKIEFTNETLQLEELELDLSWNSLAVYLEDFLGGGKFAKVLQNMLPNIGKNVFERYKSDILRNMNTALKNALNTELQKPAVKKIIEGLIPSKLVNAV